MNPSIGEPDTISILVPSRGRPQNLERLQASILGTVSHPLTIQLVVRLDEDDPELDNYRFPFKIPHHRLLVGPRVALSDMWNECWRRAYGSIFMLGADDIVFQSENWDVKVRDAFHQYPDRIAHVFGSGLHEQIDPPFGTHGFLHRNWTDVVGRFVPRGFGCDFNDAWINTVAQKLGRQCPIDIRVEHLHPSHGLAEWDDTYHEQRQKYHIARKLWDATAHERAKDARKLWEFMNSVEKAQAWLE